MIAAAGAGARAGVYSLGDPTARRKNCFFRSGLVDYDSSPSFSFWVAGLFG